MNLTEFRDQLTARAGETGHQQDPLPELRRRIRTTKRRRATTAAATVGAAVGVALVATVIPAGIDRLNGSEPAPAEAPPADVVKGAIRYPGMVGGDTLVKAMIGDLGQEFSFDVDVPASGETWVRPVCELPGTTANTLSSKYWVQVWVGGTMQITSPCGEGEGPKAGEQYWAHSVRDTIGMSLKGMEPGRRARITVRVGVDNPSLGSDPSVLARAQAGVGVYRLGPHRVVEKSGNGTRIPEVVDHQGHTYRLADVQTRWVEQVGSRWAWRDAAVTTSTPAGTPFLVRYLTIGRGTEESRPTPGVRTLRMTGIQPPITVSHRYDPKAEIRQLMPRIDPVRVEARPAGSVTVVMDGPDVPDASMMLAVYRQER